MNWSQRTLQVLSRRNCELSFLSNDRNHPLQFPRIKYQRSEKNRIGRSRSHSRINSGTLFQDTSRSISSVFCMWLHFQHVPLLIARYFRDTVSSVGFIRGKTLPGTDDLNHICLFRHALALDERRVKFLPEYARGGVCLPGERAHSNEGFVLWKPVQQTGDDDKLNPKDNAIPPSQRVKEFWFAGTHSDMYVCFPVYFRQSSLMRYRQRWWKHQECRYGPE